VINNSNIVVLKRAIMKLKRFLLRYHPPGIILEYLRKSGEVETKSIDLLNLTPE
jgi:dynein assembly factor with WDR repeat domains 1